MNKESLSDPNSTVSQPDEITINTDKQYRLSLERAVYYISRVHPEWKITFTDEAADITVTDRFTDKQCAESADLGQFAKEKSDIILSQLLYRDNGTVKGVPLFLKIQSFWYDTLYEKMREIKIPHTLQNLLGMQNSENAAIMLQRGDNSALFWGITAPYYLGCGGSEEELETGRFDKTKMENAISKTSDIIKKSSFCITDEATVSFKSEQALFYLTDVANISAERYNMPINSSLFFSPFILFDSFNDIPLILRTAYISVNSKTNSDTAYLFLNELYKNETLINMLKYTEIPIACHIDYKDSSVPELIANVNNTISSTGLSLYYINCQWNDSLFDNIENAMDLMVEDNKNVKEIANFICQ